MNFVLIKKNAQLNKVFINDIIYIKAEGDYAAIHLKSKRFIVHKSFIDLEEILNKEIFCRVHRSYIVNINHIEFIIHDEINMSDQTIIPIGNYKKKEFLAKFVIL